MAENSKDELQIRVGRAERTTFFTQTAPRQGNRFPNLGTRGAIVAIFVSSYFAAQITCNATILLLYGRHAFFDEGLRVADWKHSVLSNGVYLSWYGTLMIGPTVVPVTALFVFAEEFAAGRVRAFLGQRSPWLTAGARVIGGAALLGFSFWLYRQGFPLMHPIPLSAVIGGVVLISKGVASFFRGRSS
jgi:hypothetical protein